MEYVEIVIAVSVAPSEREALLRSIEVSLESIEGIYEVEVVGL